MCFLIFGVFVDVVLPWWVGVKSPVETKAGWAGYPSVKVGSICVTSEQMKSSFDVCFNPSFDVAVMTCDPPSQISDGTFSPVKDTYNYRDVVIYKCSGDLVLSGSKTLMCSEDGTFEPDPPKCSRE